LIDFGSVREGEPVFGRFAFANYAEVPLEIEMVSTCDCIESDWSIGPILPNQLGEVLLKFNSKGEGPDVMKTIDLIFKNVDDKGYPLIKQLYLKGKIVQ